MEVDNYLRRIASLVNAVFLVSEGELGLSCKLLYQGRISDVD